MCHIKEGRENVWPIFRVKQRNKNVRVVLVGRQKSLMISRRARHPVKPGRAPEMGAFRQALLRQSSRAEHPLSPARLSPNHFLLLRKWSPNSSLDSFAIRKRGKNHWGQPSARPPHRSLMQDTRSPSRKRCTLYKNTAFSSKT